ncbi:MAG: penicillin-insensitive murein endopeptidase, partial [Candidatus Competibacter sp.]
VNAIIKQALCNSETDRGWLNKIRPWWGHDAHFHVRLRCPPGSPQCDSQKPVPFGDGCDPDLANWVRDIVQSARNPKPQKKAEPPSTDNLPTACYAILNGGSTLSRR